ncbi:MAG: nicotinate-nucleotide--dimethylbenzimidazole phosphoribosyltransferase [Chloroflexota bacterium]|nr:nicotinate-nucleotide--dimethylbenzimidazole phosphoribosyltransferase [Chloroflexota bacterium]
MGTSLTRILEQIQPLDKSAMAAAKKRQNSLTKPHGSLGRLEDLSIQIAGMTGNPLPKLEKKAVITMAGDHGVVAEGTSLYPQEVTPQMVYNFLDGGAAINVLGRHVGARVVVVDMGVAAGLPEHPEMVCKMIGLGTENMAKRPAMSRDQAADCIQMGIDVFEDELAKGLDIVGTGDMGIGNTTASSAVGAVITGEPVEAVTGRGTGLDDEGLAHKIDVIQQAIKVNKPDPNDAIDVLSKVGGFEIGGIAGVILGAAAHRIPVVIDGFISGAGALIAAGLCPLSREYMIPAHVSVEIGHQVILRHLGLDPLVSLNMRLGEGTGAALGISLAEASTKILAEMATFGEAGVTEAE